MLSPFLPAPLAESESPVTGWFWREVQHKAEAFGYISREQLFSTLIHCRLVQPVQSRFIFLCLGALSANGDKNHFLYSHFLSVFPIEIASFDTGTISFCICECCCVAGPLCRAQPQLSCAQGQPCRRAASLCASLLLWLLALLEGWVHSCHYLN